MNIGGSPTERNQRFFVESSLATNKETNFFMSLAWFKRTYVLPLDDRKSKDILADRLTVGRLVLVQEIGVRFPVRQQLTASTSCVKMTLSQLARSTIQLQKTPQANPEQKAPERAFFVG